MGSILITVGEDLCVSDSRIAWVVEHRPSLPGPVLFPFQSAGACWSLGQPPSALGMDLASTSKAGLFYFQVSRSPRKQSLPLLGPSLLSSNSNLPVQPPGTSSVPSGWSSFQAFPPTQFLGVLFGMLCRTRWCGFL